jgi:hypothetical protein
VLCDDGEFCNGLEPCDLVSGCLAGTPPVCDDAIPCTTDSCDEETDGCGHAANDAVCNDGDPCTDDSCDRTLGCLSTPNAATCDDGNPCTSEDQCADGTCAGVGLVCDDDNLCTTDTCDPQSGCVHAPVSCDDGLLCTEDECCPTTGCSHTELDCSLLDTECGVGVCDPAQGVCVTEPTEDCCDDGNPCTVDVQETGGSCTHTPVDCDDANACTTDACDVESGCEHAPVDCGDGVDCTLDACVPASGCTHATSDALCDDGQFCSGIEACDAQTGCVPGSAVSCNDGNVCTLDACDEEADACRFDALPDPTPECGGSVCTPTGSIDVIDFETFAEGAIVHSAFTAGGLGPIGVVGSNPRFPGVCAAVIFDSSCPGGCSGGDSDLGTPGLTYGGPGIGHTGGCGSVCANDRPYGKILIVDENMVDADDNGLIDDPDDQADRAVTFDFDFSEIAPVTIHHLVFIDIEATEAPATVELFTAGDVPIDSFAVPPCGNNGVVFLELPDVSGVGRMLVTLHASGAVAEIALSAEACPE